MGFVFVSIAVKILPACREFENPFEAIVIERDAFDACIVQAEASKCGTPIFIGFAVPFAVAVVAESGNAVFGNVIVKFAFFITDLAVCDGNDVICPNAAKFNVLQSSFPIESCFEVSLGVGVAGKLVNVFFLGANEYPSAIAHIVVSVFFVFFEFAGERLLSVCKAFIGVNVLSSFFERANEVAVDIVAVNAVVDMSNVFGHTANNVTEFIVAKFAVNVAQNGIRATTEFELGSGHHIASIGVAVTVTLDYGAVKYLFFDNLERVVFAFGQFADEGSELVVAFGAVSVSGSGVFLDGYVYGVASIIVEVNVALTQTADELRLSGNEAAVIVNVPNGLEQGAKKVAEFVVAILSVSVTYVIGNAADDVAGLIDALDAVRVNFGGANQVRGSVELNVAILRVSVLFVVAEGCLF